MDENIQHKRAEIAAKTAEILIEIGAISFDFNTPFTLTSGRRSPVYVDVRRLMGYPEQRRIITNMAVEVITDTVGIDNFDVIIGGETAGIPFAAWIAEQMNLPMAYVRKQPKGFGKNAAIEGKLILGDTAILVEDLVTDGGSKIHFCDRIRKSGAYVFTCLVIFSYGDKAARRLSGHNVQLVGLTDWSAVLAQLEGQRTEEEMTKIREAVAEHLDLTDSNSDGKA